MTTFIAIRALLGAFGSIEDLEDVRFADSREPPLHGKKLTFRLLSAFLASRLGLQRSTLVYAYSKRLDSLAGSFLHLKTDLQVASPIFFLLVIQASLQAQFRRRKAFQRC